MSYLIRLLKIKFFNNGFPFVVRWDITARCPMQCRYCDIWKLKIKELNTATILRIIDEMAQEGVKKISFSGGEPLLREDICEIVHYTKAKGISAEINSTGYSFADKAERLKSLDLIKLSLDGPKEIHDVVRGREGAYDSVIDAALAAKKQRIPFRFCVTLSGYNIQYVGFLLQLARDCEAKIVFQPLKDIRYLKHCSFIFKTEEQLFPAPEQFQKAIHMLLKCCKEERRLISNSPQTLRHIYYWPKYAKLKCWAGKIFCMISPSGEISPCDRLFYDVQLPNCAQTSFRQAVTMMPRLPFCEGCGFWGSLVLNYAANFKADLELLRKAAQC
ncbi:MAG: hypothetical protein A2Y00_07095 [Omnitrophica WOR_2 bacterium GWF2_43_52]|nr:MAG: hypothetical protein A2Y00_07095 [Omnitrophica WOR_2 bacterium GWF2_43_52]